MTISLLLIDSPINIPLWCFFMCARIARGWIESIWIGFRLLHLESFVWYDVQTTGISRVALFIWPSLGAANKEKGESRSRCWLYQTWASGFHSITAPCCSIHSSSSWRFLVWAGQEWHCLLPDVPFMQLCCICVWFIVCWPAGGTSMAVRCAAVSSVLPSPVTSTAAMAIGRTGRAAPSACVKVTELSCIHPRYKIS